MKNQFSIDQLENLLSFGIEISYQDRLFLKSVNFEWAVDYEYYNPHAMPKTLKQRRFFNTLTEAVSFFLEHFSEMNDELGLVSGGASLYGEHEKLKMKVFDLLSKNIAYLKDIKEIDAVSDHPDANWDVYKNIKRMQKRLESNKDLIATLPPIQIYNDAVIDGAHRLNALCLMSQKDPTILDIELNVEIFSKISKAYTESKYKQEHLIDCPWWKDYHACHCGAFDKK